MNKKTQGAQKGKTMKPRKKSHAFFNRIIKILESARTNVVRTVNSQMVIAYYLIGREIVQEQQGGEDRAEYGQRLLEELSIKLTERYGIGFSIANLRNFRQFFLIYQDRLIHYPVGSELKPLEKHYLMGSEFNKTKKGRPLGDQLNPEGKSSPTGSQLQSNHKLYQVGSELEFIGKPHPVGGEFASSQKSYPAGSEFEQLFSPELGWSHYRALMRVDNEDARSFYEIEAVKNRWSRRVLERQINSLLFERLLKSRDKKGVKSLAQKGQKIENPVDALKDPYVLEFLNIPESSRLVETELETALITHLQEFLMELGNGFAFIARQKRLTLEGDHFYPDLLFYHTVLKSYVIIDLKVAKLTHGDLGQMQMYVNYFDREIRRNDDNPTIGLILCTDKNDAVVRYLLPEKERKIFASRYKLGLPTEKDLEKEIKRKMKSLTENPAHKSRKKPKKTKKKGK